MTFALFSDEQMRPRGTPPPADVDPLMLKAAGIVVHFSDDNLYRTWLERTVPGNGTDTVVFVMLNPSKSNGLRTDTTMEQVLVFARNAGAGRVIVVNMFALCSTDPSDLAVAKDPIGWARVDGVVRPNDAEIALAVAEADMVVAAWGASVPFDDPREAWALGRADAVLKALVASVGEVYCLGRTAGGEPRHPSRLGHDTELELYAREAAGGGVEIVMPARRGGPAKCRSCSECEGRHHFSDAMMGTREDEPEHAAAKAGCTAWYTCKHCAAWRESTGDEHGA